MSMYGSASVAISYDDAPGGSPQTITNYVTEIGGVKIEATQAATEAFGDVWAEHTPTGHKKVPPISIKGFFNDAATSGPHVVFKDVDDSPTDSTRSLSVNFGGATASGETRLVSYEVIGKNRGLTEYEAMVQVTGALTWS